MVKDKFTSSSRRFTILSYCSGLKLILSLKVLTTKLRHVQKDGVVDLSSQKSGLLVIEMFLNNFYKNFRFSYKAIAISARK